MPGYWRKGECACMHAHAAVIRRDWQAGRRTANGYGTACQREPDRASRRAVLCDPAASAGRRPVTCAHRTTDAFRFIAWSGGVLRRRARGAGRSVHVHWLVVSPQRAGARHDGQEKAAPHCFESPTRVPACVFSLCY
jgi:hypothetical protein